MPANTATLYGHPHDASWSPAVRPTVTRGRVMTRGPAAGTLTGNGQAGARAQPLAVPPRVAGQGRCGRGRAHDPAGSAGHGLRGTGRPAPDHRPVHVDHVPARLR